MRNLGVGGSNPPLCTKLTVKHRYPKGDIMPFKTCEICGKRMWKSKIHICEPNRGIPKITIKFSSGHGSSRGGTHSVRSFIHDEYMNRTFHVNIEDRSGIVRLFMKAIKECDSKDWRKARRIHLFLKRFHLSRAEIHAILFNKGFRYSNIGTKGACSNPMLRNIYIDGYHNHHKTK